MYGRAGRSLHAPAWSRRPRPDPCDCASTKDSPAAAARRYRCWLRRVLGSTGAPYPQSTRIVLVMCSVRGYPANSGADLGILAPPDSGACSRAGAALSIVRRTIRKCALANGHGRRPGRLGAAQASRPRTAKRWRVLLPFQRSRFLTAISYPPSLHGNTAVHGRIINDLSSYECCRCCRGSYGPYTCKCGQCPRLFICTPSRR